MTIRSSLTSNFHIKQGTLAGLVTRIKANLSCISSVTDIFEETAHKSLHRKNEAEPFSPKIQAQSIDIVETQSTGITHSGAAAAEVPTLQIGGPSMKDVVKFNA